MSTEPTQRPARSATPGALPSFGQRRLWFLEQLHPGSPAYTITYDFRLRGRLDTEALGRAFDLVVQRHEVLRSRLRAEDGTPYVTVAEPGTFRLECLDLSGPDAVDRAREQAGAEAARSFDLARDPLFRARLLRLGTDDHVLLVTAHHSVFDAWSWDVLARELSAGYAAHLAGRTPELPRLPLQYADFAEQQRQRLTDDVVREHVDHWRDHLGDDPQGVELVCDRPRPQAPGHEGHVVEFTLSAELTEAVRTVARRHRATPFMVLLAAYHAVLARWSRAREVVVGYPFAGRTEPEYEDMVGFFVNLLPLKADLRGDPSFGELLTQVRTALLEAFARQELPFEQLVEELGLPREVGRDPLVRHTFQLLHSDPDGGPSALSLPGLEVAPFADESRATRFELEMHLIDQGRGELRGHLVYATALFDAATTARFVDHYRTFLTAVCAAPDTPVYDVELLGPEEKGLLTRWNATGRGRDGGPDVLERFTEAVRRDPESLAVVADDVRLTYGRLDARAELLAGTLRRHGLGAERVAGVFLPRGADLVVAWLAVLKAGGAYLPLDPRLPRERMAYMLGHTGVELVLTDRDLADALPEGTRAVLVAEHAADEPGDEPAAAEPGEPGDASAVAEPREGAHPAALMHVIYTSGSTGRPKGVAIERRSFANLLDWHIREQALGPGDTATQVANISFDAAGWEIWGALASGACLHFPPDDTIPSAEKMVEYLAESGTTVVFATPAVAEQLVGHPLSEVTDVRTLLTGGDLFRPQPADVAKVPGLNVYGPTEGTVLATATGLDVTHPGNGIGRPIDNVRVHVLDDRLRPVGVGLPGEIYLAGEGLARGYFGAPALTAERFLPDPFAVTPGGRLYRTGDLGRWNSHGVLEFLGRADRQVKIRGYRVETGEIEAALRALPGVRDAAVGPAPVRGSQRLIAWYTPDGEDAPAGQELRDRLRGNLPEYMLPDIFVALATMPMTTSGKIARTSLPVPEKPGGEYVAPRDECEAAIARIWAEALHLPRVGVEDDFFEIGGHSLIATRITARILDTFGTEVPLRDLFERRTVAALARVVEEQVSAQVGAMSEEELLTALDTEGEPW
ncbi:amino acid adenylation domain-containing protein [Streptomyces sp. NPDC001851]|uniref:non-ribosomal peptide synthetase n=1 Tax=Streptomyces sp. NPDC001851 TaxID=3154529 RepID=UPI003328F6C2